MRGAAMSLTVAANGFVVLLLSLPGTVFLRLLMKGENGWRVTYTPPQICALKGSTVIIHCSYTYPSTIYPVNPAEKTFWYTKESNGVHVDLRTDPEYSGRVQYHCGNNRCTLTITDLRESDSAQYYCRSLTTQPDGTYTGVPGVTLSVTDLQVQVSRSEVHMSFIRAELKCHSSCHLPGPLLYIWYKNGKKWGPQSHSLTDDIYDPASRYSCAVTGHEDSSSPTVSMQGEKGWGVTYTSTELCAFKGSTVEIHCSYRYPSRIYSHSTAAVETFWFTKNTGNDFMDLKTDPQYSSRVHDGCNENNCTLRITDLRESDSAEYKFRFTTTQPGGKYYGHPGVTLSVTEPQLQVHVRRSTASQNSTWTELTCHNKCRLPDHSSYIWYKNGLKVKNEKVYFYPNLVNPADNYSCAIKGYEMFPSPSVYAPKLPSVSVSPSAEIVEGDSVNLTCSSDANPAAKCTWYKRSTNPEHKHLSEEPQLFFSSIQSSDSGEYYCAAENKLGRKTSEFISIDVQYAPKLLSVSVSPSAEIVEGRSVTLTCSSDAKPAANYTWYKENQTLLRGSKESYYFTSIRSEDSGSYHCKSENQYGQISSLPISIDVQYAPQLPSVSVSPSAEIAEGSSVTLTCSSDANPAANYTWYKEDEDSPKASGQIFTISNVTAEHSGNYYCEAQNTRGRHNSTLQLIAVAVLPEVWKSVVIGAAPGVSLAVIWLSVLLLIRKKRASKKPSEPGDRPDPDNREQGLPSHSKEQDDLHYASVHFKTHTDPVYSNIRPAGLHTDEEEAVEYAAVVFNSASTPPRTTGQKSGEDAAAVYSTVTKTDDHNRNL